MGCLITGCSNCFERMEDNIPTLEEWSSSKYQMDNAEHSGRLICVIDLLSVGWQFAKEIGKIAYETLLGFGALILSVFLIPAAKIASFIASYKNPPHLLDSDIGAQRPLYEKRLHSWKFTVYKTLLHNLYRAPIDFALFFVYFAPKQIIKMGGNAIGIVIPEIGKFVRQNVNTSEDLVPNYEDWCNSKYEMDKKDHVGRMVCVVDMFSQVWRLSHKIVEIGGMFILSLGSIVFSCFLIPATAIAKGISSFRRATNEGESVEPHYVIKLTEWRDQAWNNMAATVSALLLLGEFLFILLPKIILKMSGNLAGVAFPEFGRESRLCSLLKLPEVKKEEPDSSHLHDSDDL